MKEFRGPAAPFKAGARDDSTAYTDIKKGSLAIKNVADLYLYDNVAAIIKLTGAQLKEWLEMSAGQFNTIDPNNKEEQELVNTAYRTYNFDVIDGVDYDLDVTQKNKYDISGNLVNENSERVKNLTYKGQVVDPKQEFIVVTNNYRMSGKFLGVKDAGFKQLLSLENRQAIINYIVSEKNINPTADFNWNFVDTIKGLNLTFKTAQIAKGLLERYPNISYLADVENGFTKYKYDYKDRVFKVENPIEENQSQVEKTNPVIKDQKDDLNSKNQEDLKEFEKEIENTKVADIIERISSKEKAINTWIEKVVVEDSLSKDSFRKTSNLATKQSELKISSDTNKSSLLPKTNISTDSDVKLPAALATILIAAGLMVRRKENRIK
ncbi:5'-nucleotidase C-terminal domain-containing protein [Gemella sp. GL1.1]|nr:5'-nucleotidase C-terminal domain-containing protein [Gemella sp. GL1.1]NYS27645.1 5'-nucleotidase C-terminal domain-containing protein [Gemella sp. GL1]